MKGRRGEHIRKLINPEALFILPEAHYYAILELVANRAEPAEHDLFGIDLAWARFAILAMSAWGGVAWPGAERYLRKLTLGDVLHNLDMPRGRAAFYESRKGADYPIFISIEVEQALWALVAAHMRARPLANNHLRPLPEETLLAPADRVNLEEYLAALGRAVGMICPPTVAEFQAATRYLLKDTYALDVIYGLLGAMDTAAIDREQLEAVGPEALLRRLRGPFRARRGGA